MDKPMAHHSSPNLKKPNQTLNITQYIAYISPTMMLAFLWGPIGILQGIYAKYYHVSLTAIATVLLISRLFDAITDPLIGYWSDSYKVKVGSRKPFVLMGGLLFIVSSYFLYVPVDIDSIDSSTVVSTSYFLVWFLLFYFSWTLFEIPHLAWAAELTPKSKDKSKIYSLRSLSVFIGILFFYLVPFLPFFSTQEFTPHTLQWAAITAGLLMLPALYFCLTHTPKHLNTYKHTKKTKKESFFRLFKEVISNKPFLLFTLAFTLFNAGSYMWFTLIFIFVDSYLKLGNHFAFLTIIALISSMVMLGFWHWLASNVSKKAAWAIGMMVYIIGSISSAFLTPGEESLIGLSIAILLVYIGGVPAIAIAPSLLADIIDYSTWKFRTDRTATYFSLYTFCSKTSLAIGSAIGLGIAGWYGFDPASESHTADTVFGLHLSACWLPALFITLSIFIIRLIPINSYQHSIIRKRLDARLSRNLISNKNSDNMTIQPVATVSD